MRSTATAMSWSSRGDLDGEEGSSRTRGTTEPSCSLGCRRVHRSSSTRIMGEARKIGQLYRRKLEEKQQPELKRRCSRSLRRGSSRSSRTRGRVVLGGGTGLGRGGRAGLGDGRRAGLGNSGRAGLGGWRGSRRRQRSSFGRRLTGL